MGRVAIGLIHLYRFLLSPWVGNQCRFHPSCSHYGEEAIRQHGFVKGSVLTIWRILRCNPWHPGGFDYVPGTEPKHMNCETSHHGETLPRENLINSRNKEQRSTV